MYYVIGQPLKFRLDQPQFRYYREERERALRKNHEKCQKKRQTLVHNPEDDISYEPYMSNLQKEYSETSIKCDSNFELPWKDIAFVRDKIEIRREVDIRQVQSNEKEEIGESNMKVNGRKTLSDKMELPWNEILIDNMVDKARRQQQQHVLKACDSSLEIPWEDLALESPTKIKDMPEAEICSREDIEIPWDSIILPKNIIIEPKMRKHPSTNTKRRPKSNLDCKYSTCCDRCTREKKILNPVGSRKPV